MKKPTNGHTPPPAETPHQRLKRLRLVLSNTVATLREIGREIEALEKLLIEERRK